VVDREGEEAEDEHGDGGGGGVAMSAVVSLVDWPASREAMDQGRAFLREANDVIVACDHDVDGLASAVLVARGVERLGRLAKAEIVPIHRGEHVHKPSYVARLRAAAKPETRFVVTDMGSRPEKIGLGRPILLLDHHDADRDKFPPDALVVSAARRVPVAPTSYLAFELLRTIVDVEDLAWLALLGSVADLSTAATFGDLPKWRAHYRVKDISESIALLNAARRAGSHDVATSLAVLRAAKSPREIAEGTAPGVMRLREHRAEVSAEVNRVAKMAPRVLTPKTSAASGHPKVAYFHFESKAQIHPLIAMRWKTRLAGGIILVANEGFPSADRVSFVVRSTRHMDLLVWLREVAAPLGDLGPDFARGHPAATGGNLSRADFARFLTELGG